MSGSIKRLAGQTAIYGLSSIVGRLLNYFLVPLYTHQFATQEYGVVVELYSYVAFLIIIVTYGMETAFFRFSQNEPLKKDSVFSTALISLLFSSGLFMSISIIFRQEIADIIQYPDNANYVLWFGIIVGLDALTSIPFARLRAENKPLRFAFVKLTGIAINIGLVLFFVLFCPWVIQEDVSFLKPFIQSIYNPEIGVGYVFISNLVATSFTFLMLIPVMLRSPFRFESALWRQMFIYALPLLVAGLAGIVNEALDKILLKYLLPEDIALSHIGIYGACAKIAVLMTLFIQAFRFAAEPFFFAEFQKENAKELYARVMKIFVIACLFIFLGIMFFMDIIKYFVGPEYRVGLNVVPILLWANMLLGIYFNQSIWYKLTGQTQYGAWIAIIGAGITISLNIIFIPLYGYYASAWIHLVCYFLMVLISWLWSRKHFPVDYDFKTILSFMAAALILYGMHQLLPDTLARPVLWIISTFMLLVFALMVAVLDKEVKRALMDLMKKAGRKM